MTELLDFVALSSKDLWLLVDSEGVRAEKRFIELWEKVEEHPLTQDESVECLNALAIYTHVRIREYDNTLYKKYPTRQFTKMQLAHCKDLWWVDHFTAGINQWSTLNWFSAEKTATADGTTKYHGASTHFVMGYHDHPMYIIPLMHGAWHEPRRNKDSIGIEHVNAGAVHLDPKTKRWHYWAGQLPQELVMELPPVNLSAPFRGVKTMQPFTKDQIIQNIKLKRVVIAALPGRLVKQRMSQHQDWRDGKTDMGPLWPFDEVNKAAYLPDPLAEISYLQNWEESSTGKTVDPYKIPEVDESINPSYGTLTPTHDNDEDSDSPIITTEEVQKSLSNLGLKTVLQFQELWNKRNSKDKIKEDGIPGPVTCSKLKSFKL